MYTQKASDELRTLEAAEIDAVAGAATISMGLFGKLHLSDKSGAAIAWTTEDDTADGVLTTTIIQWPA